MSKHTPGPWIYARNSDTFQVATVESFGIYSTHREGGSADCGRPEDDARLIAAAPELLEVLKTCASMLSSARLIITDDVGRAMATEAIDQARAAIAKAEGK